MRKIVIIILALVLALGALPITFACGGGWHWHRFWQPQRTVYCCPENCKLIFTSVEDGDNEWTFTEPKDVGHTTASITCCGKTLTITIDNAYPGYEGIVDFCVRNTGSMAATITGITIDNHDPGYLQIDLTGAIQNGTVISPCTTQCGQLVIGGIPQLEDAQNRTFTFDITIDYNCTCVPGNCETAYAFGGCDAHCFLNLCCNHWGWTNGPLGPGHYEFQIWAGAAQCNLSKGDLIGTLTVDYDGSEVDVHYDIAGSGYTMTKTHLYVYAGPNPIPTDHPLCIPGQYPDKHDPLNATEDDYTVTGFSGEGIYVIAHADVCR